MAVDERYRELYWNFPDRQQWIADALADMTLVDYLGFTVFLFEKLDFAAAEKDGTAVRRVKGLIMALARKELEISHFMDGLTDEQKLASIKAANSYYELAKIFYLPESIPDLEAAWAASLDRAAHFGWPSAVFDVLVPHQVFRNENEWREQRHRSRPKEGP